MGGALGESVAKVQVELYIRQPGHPERRFLVSQGATRIGRADDNDVVLSDLGVSRRHARIVLDGQSLSVEDLGSGNGTLYRGSEIDKQALGDGDEVHIDPFVLVFRYRSAESVSAPHEEEDRTLKAQPQGPGRREGAFLVVLAGHRLASKYPVPATGLTMGRSESRDVVLFDPGASRNHLRIELRVGGYWLVDLGSANGTWLNARRAKENPLMPGDRIRIGTTEFRFEVPGQPDNLGHRQARDTLPDSVDPIRDLAHWGRPPVVAPAGSTPPSARPPPTAMEWVMAIGVLVGLVLVSIIGVHLFQILTASDRVVAKSRLRSVDLAMVEDMPEEAQDRMAEGQIRFHEGDYFLAAENFIKVNRLLDEASNTRLIEALWLERTAYEAIVFDVLKQELGRTLRGDQETEASRLDAVKSAQAALKEGEGHAQARRAVVQAQSMELGRQDAELQDLKKQLDTELVRMTGQDEHRDHRHEMAERVDEGDSLLEEGNFRGAIALYEAVLTADPEARTHSYYDAQDGIKVATERMTLLKTSAWDDVRTALETDDDVAAAAALREILRMDPDEETAKAQLSDVEARLP